MSTGSEVSGQAVASIRLMRHEDIPLGLSLCRIAGWNQLAADWETLLALAPDGLFVAEVGGVPCATAGTMAYGKETAWIGMVLVHPDHRRHGIGTALLARCIDHLKARAIPSIKLDATDQGRPVYLQLGFADEREICRLAARRPQGVVRMAGVRAIRDEDWPAIARLDQVVFGADRTELLRRLVKQGPSAIVRKAGEVKGFGFARPGCNAPLLGPIVAVDPDTARALAASLIAELPEGNLFWDLLSDNTPAVEIAQSLGFQVTRRLMRMYLGERMNPGEIEKIFAAAGFELG
jgi:GNAT superfamily N-acetyltransferase